MPSYSRRHVNWALLTNYKLKKVKLILFLDFKCPGLALPILLPITARIVSRKDDYLYLLFMYSMCFMNRYSRLKQFCAESKEVWIYDFIRGKVEGFYSFLVLHLANILPQQNYSFWNVNELQIKQILGVDARFISKRNMFVLSTSAIYIKCRIKM